MKKYQVYCSLGKNDIIVKSVFVKSINKLEAHYAALEKMKCNGYQNVMCTFCSLPVNGKKDLKRRRKVNSQYIQYCIRERIE